MYPTDTDDLDGPSAADLAAIEDEMPLIDAGLELVNAEIAMFYAEDRGGPSPLDWRRLRRAEANWTRLAAAFASQTARRQTTTRTTAVGQPFDRWRAA